METTKTQLIEGKFTITAAFDDIHLCAVIAQSNELGNTTYAAMLDKDDLDVLLKLLIRLRKASRVRL